MWATSVPIIVFLGRSVLDLGPMYATGRQTDVRRASSLNTSALWGRGITIAKAASAHSKYTSRQFLEKERFSFSSKRSSKMRDSVSFSVTIIWLGNLVLFSG